MKKKKCKCKLDGDSARVTNVGWIEWSVGQNMMKCL